MIACVNICSFECASYGLSDNISHGDPHKCRFYTNNVGTHSLDIVVLQKQSHIRINLKEGPNILYCCGITETQVN